MIIMHEYCYENGRKCCDPNKCDQDFKCSNCSKPISDCEWVVNWGSCSKCFSDGYEQYMKTLDHKPKYEKPLEEPWGIYNHS